MNFADVLVILLITGGATKAAAYFASAAAGMPVAARRSIAIRSVAIQAVVLAIFAAFGGNILGFFHVSVAALEVAGGLILLLFAIGLVLGKGHDDAEDSHGAGAEMAVYPLAVPLLASPQAIVATTIVSTQLGAYNRGPLWLALGIVLAINLAAMVGLAQFLKPPEPGAKSGGGFAAILLRVVALLLAALAVEIIVLGLRGYGVMGPMPGGMGH